MEVLIQTGFVQAISLHLLEPPGIKKPHLRSEVRSDVINTLCKLNLFYINGIQTSFSLLELKRNFVVFPDLVDETGYVHEVLDSGFFVFNKSKSFGFIEKFYFTLFHDVC